MTLRHFALFLRGLSTLPAGHKISLRQEKKTASERVAPLPDMMGQQKPGKGAGSDMGTDPACGTEQATRKTGKQEHTQFDSARTDAVPRAPGSFLGLHYSRHGSPEGTAYNLRISIGFQLKEHGTVPLAHTGDTIQKGQ